MTEQKLSAGMKTGLEQHQHLSHNLQRSLELLALPLPELESRLTAELATNPLLEEVFPENNTDIPADSVRENADDDDYESASDLSDEWRDDLPLPGTDDGDDKKRDFLSSLPAPPPDLRSILLTELSLMPLDETQLRLTTEIVTALNEDGYLASPLADLAMVCNAEMDELTEALDTVQKIAPPGIAARNLPECLELQLTRSGRMTPEFKKLLQDGLDDLEKNRLNSLKKMLNVSAEELAEMLQTLRSLNPVPGRSYSVGTSVIVPDLAITADNNGSYQAYPLRSNTREIAISPFYEKFLENNNLSSDDRAFFTEKLERAKELIRAVAMRGTTLKRIGDLLIEHQREFLEKGVKFLKGMTMKSAAAELDLSESTISRTVADKFVETPQGVYPLRFFFASGYRADDGNERSSQAVLEEIRSMIAAENPYSPLSDDEIARKLKNGGLNIARRTVAKYRDILKIPSSSRRKKHL